MTMATLRHLGEALPVSARARAVPLGLIGESVTEALANRARTQEKPGSGASRSQHSAAAARLARSRRTTRAAKSP